MKTSLICCLCLIVGVILGRLIPTADRSEEDGVIAKTKSEKAAVRASVRNRPRTGFDSPEGRGERSPRTNTDLLKLSEDDRLLTVPASLLKELCKGTGIPSLGQELFSQNGKSEEILKITDREKAVIQTAWRSVGDKVRKLEASSSSSENLDDGSVLITVPDLANMMTLAGKGFQSSVRKTLGENRGDIFLTMKQVDQIFAAPPGERSYKVSVEAVGDGRWRYHMTLEGPAGRRVWVSENIPNEIRHLTDAARISPQMENLSDSGM